MSREQGPHLWGCDRPRMAPAADAGVLWHAMTVKEAAS